MKPGNFSSVYQYMLDGWCVTSNFGIVKGGRILIAWLPQFFQVDVITIDAQYIHCQVHNFAHKHKFYCTVVYGVNEVKGRADLWKGLTEIGKTMSDPWLISGDFNSPLFFEDRIGRVISHLEIEDFRQCVDACELKDMPQTGCRYTWNNKQDGDHRVYTKIERTMVNEEWSASCPLGSVHYAPEGRFDHSPAIVKLSSTSHYKKRSFQFVDVWCSHGNFQMVVRQGWNIAVKGCTMFQVMQKLRLLKKGLKLLHKDRFSDLEIRFLEAQGKVQDIQRQLQQDINSNAVEQERIAIENLAWHS